jgi:hypothetical protein
MFEAKTTGLTAGMQINDMKNTRVAQNNLANGKRGGAVTVPQFATTGPSAGPNANSAIQGMAGKQLQANALGGYNHCIGQAAGTCGNANTGGTRKRKKRSRRSRKKKVKKQQK